MQRRRRAQCDVRHHGGVTVRLGLRQRRQRDDRAATGLVVDDDALTQAFFQPIGKDAADDVNRTARGVADQQANRLVWIIVGTRGDSRCEHTGTADQGDQRSKKTSHRVLPIAVFLELRSGAR